MAEHMTKNFFARTIFQNDQTSAMQLFCELFQLDDADIEYARKRTLLDFEAEKVPADEIATTAIWIWLCEAIRQYQHCCDEFVFFIWVLSSASKDDEEIKQAGIGELSKILSQSNKRSYSKKFFDAIRKVFHCQ